MFQFLFIHFVNSPKIIANYCNRKGTVGSYEYILMKQSSEGLQGDAALSLINSELYRYYYPAFPNISMDTKILEKKKKVIHSMDTMLFHCTCLIYLDLGSSMSMFGPFL